LPEIKRSNICQSGLLHIFDIF